MSPKEDGEEEKNWCQNLLLIFQAHILLILVLIVFSLVGAAIFDAVESGHEKDAIRELQIVRKDALEILW